MSPKTQSPAWPYPVLKAIAVTSWKAGSNTSKSRFSPGVVPGPAWGREGGSTVGLQGVQGWGCRGRVPGVGLQGKGVREVRGG